MALHRPELALDSLVTLPNSTSMSAARLLKTSPVSNEERQVGFGWDGQVRSVRKEGRREARVRGATAWRHLRKGSRDLATGLSTSPLSAHSVLENGSPHHPWHTRHSAAHNGQRCKAPKRPSVGIMGTHSATQIHMHVCHGIYTTGSPRSRHTGEFVCI